MICWRVVENETIILNVKDIQIPMLPMELGFEDKYSSSVDKVVTEVKLKVQLKLRSVLVVDIVLFAM